MKSSVEFWNDVCLELTRRDFTKKTDGSAATPEQGGPTATSRAMAIIHLAMHDAWFGTTSPALTYLGRLVPPVPLPVAAGPISRDSAMGTAAAITMLMLYPGQAAYINRMCAVFIDPDPTSAARDNGHKYGEAIAAALLKRRAADGSAAKMAYRPSTAYGRHRADPFDAGQPYLGPQWGDVARFCTPVRVALDPPPGFGLPDYLTDLDYRADLKEVKEKGALISTTRTPEETVIGTFWGYDGANEIGVPPRLYNQIARAWLLQHPTGVAATDTDRMVRLMTMINAAMADAAIDAWHHKYTYNLWRPVVGIREASRATGPSAVGAAFATDTAGARLGDPGWAPLGQPKTNEPAARIFSRTPPFPAYPSGHATFGAAIFQVMQRFSGAAAMTLQNVLDADPPGADIAGQEIEFVSDELNGLSIDADGSVRTRHLRRFGTFARPVFENSVSRIYLGVHWRFDGLPRADVAGKRYGGVPLGLTIGAQAFAFFN